jgi:hypothetical protein
MESSQAWPTNLIYCTYDGPSLIPNCLAVVSRVAASTKHSIGCAGYYLPNAKM